MTCDEHKRVHVQQSLKTVVDTFNGDRVAFCHAVSEWWVVVAVECYDFANRLLLTYRELQHPAFPFPSGVLIMDNRDQSTHVNTGGGDVTGSAIGAKAKVQASVIQSMKDNVDSSANIDANGKQLFKEAFDGISAAEFDDELKAELLADLNKLREEASKPAPNTGVMRKLWAAVKVVGGTLPFVAKLGAWLLAKYPGASS